LFEAPHPKGWRYLLSYSVAEIIDTEKPAIAFVDPTPANSAMKYGETNIKINVSTSDLHLANTTLYIYYSNNTLVNSSNTTYYDFTGLGVGIYYINATSCDYYNNCNSTATRIISLNSAIVSSGSSGGGGGGGSVVTQSLKIDFGSPNIQESGHIEVPVTIRNSGTLSFFGLKISAYLKKNNQATIYNAVPSKTSIATLSPSTKEDLMVSGDIKENDVSFYELVVQVSSTSPVYNDSSKILFTFVGVEGGKVLKVVAFTAGLIDEHAECLELKDMIIEAQNEFSKGNTALALQKANQAVEACKSYIESPLKPIEAKKQYDKVPVYLGIGISAAILFGVILNLYRKYIYQKRRR